MYPPVAGCTGGVGRIEEELLVVVLVVRRLELRSAERDVVVGGAVC